MLASTRLVAMEMAEEDELRETQLWEFITGGRRSADKRRLFVPLRAGHTLTNTRLLQTPLWMPKPLPYAPPPL